jgi:hypothetical protein
MLYDLRLAEDHAADALADFRKTRAESFDRSHNVAGMIGGGDNLALERSHGVTPSEKQKQMRPRMMRTMTETGGRVTPSTHSDMDRSRVENTAEISASRALPSLPPLTAICGDFPLRIARDGTWFYHGSPIGRKPLVKLFASVLRRQESGEFWLVTPAERGRIVVDDAPFVAVLCDVERSGAEQRLVFTTNLDEVVTADDAHPIRVAGTIDAPAPYVTVRPGLEARIARSVYYQLAELGTEWTGADGVTRFGVWSAGRFFALTPDDDGRGGQ